jgi:hypothetical protein
MSDPSPRYWAPLGTAPEPRLQVGAREAEELTRQSQDGHRWVALHEAKHGLSAHAEELRDVVRTQVESQRLSRGLGLTVTMGSPILHMVFYPQTADNEPYSRCTGCT